MIYEKCFRLLKKPNVSEFASSSFFKVFPLPQKFNRFRRFQLPHPWGIYTQIEMAVILQRRMASNYFYLVTLSRPKNVGIVRTLMSQRICDVCFNCTNCYDNIAIFFKSDLEKFVYFLLNHIGCVLSRYFSRFSRFFKVPYYRYGKNLTPM